MRWILPGGKSIWVSDSKYLIKWEKPAPSKGAQMVKFFIQQNYSNYIWFEEYVLPKIGKLRVDFLCPSKKIAIEFDGRQHTSYNKHFHRNRAGYRNSIGRDLIKDEFLELNGYKVVRITDDDLSSLSKEWLQTNYNII